MTPGTREGPERVRGYSKTKYVGEARLTPQDIATALYYKLGDKREAERHLGVAAGFLDGMNQTVLAEIAAKLAESAADKFCRRVAAAIGVDNWSVRAYFLGGGGESLDKVIDALGAEGFDEEDEWVKGYSRLGSFWSKAKIDRTLWHWAVKYMMHMDELTGQDPGRLVEARIDSKKIEDALWKNGGDKAATARSLGIPVNVLQRFLDTDLQMIDSILSQRGFGIMCLKVATKLRVREPDVESYFLGYDTKTTAGTMIRGKVNEWHPWHLRYENFGNLWRHCGVSELVWLWASKWHRRDDGDNANDNVMEARIDIDTICDAYSECGASLKCMEARLGIQAEVLNALIRRHRAEFMSEATATAASSFDDMVAGLSSLIKVDVMSVDTFFCGGPERREGVHDRLQALGFDMEDARWTADYGVLRHVWEKIKLTPVDYFWAMNYLFKHEELPLR